MSSPKRKGAPLRFDMNTNTGKVRLEEGSASYMIGSGGLVKTEIYLRFGDKFFSTFEGKKGADYARIIKIIALNT